jgi:hypothetical protein
MKKAVAHFFIAQLYLAASMCTGRNYTVMVKMEELYPFDFLVAIMKMDIHDSLKVCILRVLCCSYALLDVQNIYTICRVAFRCTVHV